MIEGRQTSDLRHCLTIQNFTWEGLSCETLNADTVNEDDGRTPKGPRIVAHVGKQVDGSEWETVDKRDDK